MPWFACGSHAANFPAVEISWGFRLKFSNARWMTAGQEKRGGRGDPYGQSRSNMRIAVAAIMGCQRRPAPRLAQCHGSPEVQCWAHSRAVGARGLVAWEGWALGPRERHAWGGASPRQGWSHTAAAARRHGALGHLLPSLWSAVSQTTSHTQPAQEDILRPEKGACMAQFDRLSGQGPSHPKAGPLPKVAATRFPSHHARHARRSLQQARTVFRSPACQGRQSPSASAVGYGPQRPDCNGTRLHGQPLVG